MAEARAVLGASNTRSGAVTCAGCKADNQGGDWGQTNCERMCDRGLCQKQVWLQALRILAQIKTSAANVDL